MTPRMQKEQGKDWILPEVHGTTMDLDPDFAYRNFLVSTSASQRFDSRSEG